jgi:glycerol kinase
MLILALDLGTTGNRAILFDAETRVVASSHREFRQIYPQPGWVEHDPQEIWESLRAVIAEVVSQVDPSRIAAIGIANQRETIVPWDPATGHPLHNAIVWQDRRTAERCQQLKEEGREEWIRERTGLVWDPYFSATKIEWLLRHIPETRRGVFGTVDAWILSKLTGGRVFATDVSNASRTLLYSLTGHHWDAELLELFGVERGMLPEVRPTCGSFGELDQSLFGFSCPILSVVGDQQASMFAQGCSEPGIIKNTYGTGLFLMMNTGPRPQVSRQLISTIAWQLGTGEFSYALEGSVFIGGAVVQWLRDELQLVRKSSEIEDLASGAESNDGVYFVPALAGLGAPYWDPAARGLIIGITRRTTRAHLARAALEALAYQTRDVAEIMCAENQAPLKKLQVDGGACANNFLMQFQADLLGVPVERPAVIEITALGAAGLAGIQAGLWKDPAEFVAHRRVERVFQPRLEAAERDSLYSRWKQAVERSRHWAG